MWEYQPHEAELYVLQLSKAVGCYSASSLNQRKTCFREGALSGYQVFSAILDIFLKDADFH